MISRPAYNWILFSLLAFPIALSAQSDRRQFPYQAFVINDGASIHSGPGSVHYATDEMVIDSVVEVHRHDPGGWCAIRPPQGSFSLIPATAIERTDDHVGEIVNNGIQAWVGTRLGAVDNPLCQVKLKENEMVKILGEVSWPNPEGHSTIWYQVAPPAGEFRWIRMSDIKPPSHRLELPDSFATTPPNSANRITSELVSDDLSDSIAQVNSLQDDPVFDESLDPPSNRDSTVNRGWRQATGPIRIADRRIDTKPVEPFKIPAIDSPSRSEPHFDSLAGSTKKLPDSNPSKQVSPNISPISKERLDPLSGPVSQRMVLLESSLTTEMLKSPEQWDLETILKQSTTISTSSNDLDERQHAVRLIEKIRKCIAIQSNFETAYRGSGLDDSLSGVVGSGVKTDSQVQLGTRYDAHGWLNQLVRGKGSLEPTYVLENEQGQVIFHIAPAPGLNLNRYLKSKVGIIGRRGFHRELQMNHVTAERVVVLDSIRR